MLGFLPVVLELRFVPRRVRCQISNQISSPAEVTNGGPEDKISTGISTGISIGTSIERSGNGRQQNEQKTTELSTSVTLNDAIMLTLVLVHCRKKN